MTSNNFDIFNHENNELVLTWKEPKLGSLQNIPF